jgi:hypothetical protein
MRKASHEVFSKREHFIYNAVVVAWTIIIMAVYLALFVALNFLVNHIGHHSKPQGDEYNYLWIVLLASGLGTAFFWRIAIRYRFIERSARAAVFCFKKKEK